MFDKNHKIIFGNKLPNVIRDVPFSKKKLDFLSDLSKFIFKQKKLIKYPEIISFAYWCRRANLIRMKSNHNSKELRFGKGLVFHIVPSNVPINFAYSFAFGLLSGNSNILRISSREDKSTKVLCDLIKILIKKKKYKNLYNSNCILSYEKETQITKFLSGISDVRMIWGGDKTINKIKSLPSKSSSVDISFPDKYSISMINLNKINKNNIKNLVNNFFNDSFVMDQNACSSPHMIIWLNKNSKNVGKVDFFWRSLLNKVNSKYIFSDDMIYKKITRNYENIVKLNNSIKSSKNYGEKINVTTLKKITKNIDQIRGIFGSFYQYYSNNLSCLGDIKSEKLQTISYFGMNKNKIIEILYKYNLSQISRVVPIGKSLDLNLIWDGYDLIESMTNTIKIE